MEIHIEWIHMEMYLNTKIQIPNGYAYVDSYEVSSSVIELHIHTACVCVCVAAVGVCVCVL